MRGRDVLWQPGTDHAGIATQMVVERQLMERQEPGRRALGREKFLEKVWAWKAESGGTITKQLKRLGASCDWSRERFTMDEGLSRAVLKVFVELYREGLIYKDKRLVNWDPKLLTAISDLEVQQVEVKGHLWHFRYPIEGVRSMRTTATFITVATTRPETMLGDTAVAVHPEDERYRHLVGKHVDPAAGRPAHSDHRRRILRSGEGHRRGQDHARARLQRFRGRPAARPAAGQRVRRRGQSRSRGQRGVPRDVPASAELDETLAYHGLDRFAARKKIVERMEAAGLLAKIEPHTHTVPHGDRSGVVIEPYLTDQWYVDAKTLPQPAIAAVRDGRTVFVPRNWETTYFNWMENIQPWCISRQLWWGHQIPAWYGAATAKCSSPRPRTKPLPRALALLRRDRRASRERAGAGDGRAIRKSARRFWRDEDVLDTWFSSALWPFSTLGWPDETPELKRYYPDRRAGHRLRHHLLLGRAHDDDGPALHEGGAVPHRLHPRAGARRARRQDVEVEGQRHRPARS